MKLAAEKMMFGNIGTIHFIGIGGIGMSGIAEILHSMGYKVQGSDISENYVMEKLRAKGIEIFIGHSAENIKNAQVVVKSTAISADNPEIIEAKKNHIMVISRSDMLGEIMKLKISVAISGTHGKTTTTSLVAIMFESAGLDPTVINGGIINHHGSNAYLGKGDFLIVEADESDETFIKIPSTIGVITNIDPEHLDHYGDFANLKKAFRNFITNLSFYGFAVLCKDHREVAKLSEEVFDRKILTYGIEREDVNIRAVNIKTGIDGSDFDVVIKDYNNNIRMIKSIHLPIAGLHNVLNSLAAIAIAIELKFSDEVITNGFRKFQGVKRRFTKTGEVNNITIIDDYAHHPQEIMVALKTGKLLTNESKGRLIAIVQPHRYSRVSDCFSEFTHCFDEADILIVADIYGAGEKPIEGITKDILVDAIKQVSKCKTILSLDNPENLAKIISDLAKPKDLILFMGAGSSTKWANELPAELEKLCS